MNFYTSFVDKFTIIRKETKEGISQSTREAGEVSENELNPDVCSSIPI